MNSFRNFATRFASRAGRAMGEAGRPGGGSGGGGPGGGGAAAAGSATLVLLGLGTYGLYNSIVTIQPGHKGIIYSRYGGLSDRAALREGMNFVVPWFQRAIVFDVRTRPQPIDTQSGSKDLQMVSISLRVLFKPDPNELVFIYRRLGKDYDARVMPSIVNEVTKAVVAQYNAAELLTKRNEVSKQIREMLVKRSGDFHILLDDVAITHLSFSREYTAAVEAKQVAQQDSERAKYIVERAIQEKRSIVIKAEGEAKSAELIGNAIKKNPAFVQLRRIEASKEIASMIVTSPNKIYLGSESLMINQLGESLLEGENKTGSGASSSRILPKLW